MLLRIQIIGHWTKMLVVKLLPFNGGPMFYKEFTKFCLWFLRNPTNLKMIPKNFPGKKILLVLAVVLPIKIPWNFFLVNRFGNVTFTENQYHLNMNGPTTSEVDMISIADVMMNWRKNPKLLNKDSNDSFKLEHFYSGLFNILLSTWCESVALLGGNGNNDKRHQNSSGLIRYIDITKC